MRTKLEPKAIKCIFLGYSGTQKGYKCYCPSNRKMYVTMDVVFREEDAYYNKSDQSNHNTNTSEWTVLDITKTIDSRVRLDSQPVQEMEQNVDDNEDRTTGNEEFTRPPITQIYTRRKTQLPT